MEINLLGMSIPPPISACRASWRTIVGAFVLALVAFFAPGTPAHGQSTAIKLRVLTYNIHHGEGTDRALDLKRIAAVIQSTKPDLVALQEVDKETTRTHRIDQAARLGELTGLHSVFGKAMDYQGGAYGLAILSRWPLTKTRTLALPADAGIEPRTVLSAEIPLEAGAGSLSFLVTHLDHRADPTHRTRQAARIRELFPPDDQPALFAGDFNATPDSPVMQAFFREWTDSAPGATFLTSPAGQPARKIDHILYRPASRWRVLETAAIEERTASDHRPVLAVLELLP